MARRTFFSFHYENDIWRANQIRNLNVVVGSDAAGFFDHSEWEEAKKKGEDAIRRLIQKNLENTTVTVVLIGAETSWRQWVQYEVSESIGRKNGLLGIHIHMLKDQNGHTSVRGSAPTVPAGTTFPCYDWDGSVQRLANEIEAAGKRADAMRNARSW